MSDLLSKDALALSDKDFDDECSNVKQIVERFDIYEVIRCHDLDFLKKVLPLMIAVDAAQVKRDLPYWQFSALHDAAMSKDSGDVQTLAIMAYEFSKAFLEAAHILNPANRVPTISREEQFERLNADAVALADLLAESDYECNLQRTIENLRDEIRQPINRGLFLVQKPK